MNIQEWKKFSDAIDKYNIEEINKHFISFRELEDSIKRNEFNWLRVYHPKTLEKSEVNFWEWKAGKLDLSVDKNLTQL